MKAELAGSKDAVATLAKGHQSHKDSAAGLAAQLAALQDEHTAAQASHVRGICW